MSDVVDWLLEGFRCTGGHPEIRSAWGDANGVRIGRSDISGVPMLPEYAPHYLMMTERITESKAVLAICIVHQTRDGAVAENHEAARTTRSRRWIGMRSMVKIGGLVAADGNNRA